VGIRHFFRPTEHIIIGCAGAVDPRECLVPIFCYWKDRKNNWNNEKVVAIILVLRSVNETECL
jgi:hypothetical protein